MKKRGLALFLALILALGCSSAAWAADAPYVIIGAGEDFGGGGYTINGTQRRYGFLQDFAHLASTRPGDEYFYPLRSQDFEWEKMERRSRPSALTPDLIKELQFDLRLEYITGGEAIDRIALVKRGEEIGVLVDFRDVHHSTGQIRFQVKAHLVSGGAGIEGTEFYIAGTLANRNRNVYSAYTTISLGVGRMATGMYDVFGATFDLGGGVTLAGDLLFGDKVYGAVSEAMTDADKAIREKHPQITRVLHIRAIGLSGKVRIDPGDGSTLYVYDADLNYLGTTADNLRFARTYYLTTQKI